MRRSHVYAILIAIVVLTGGFVVGARLQPPARVTEGPVGKPSAQATAIWEPIYMGTPIQSGQEAISKTLEWFPSGHNPTSEIARLVSKKTLETSWFTGIEEENDAEAAAPVWLVGVLGSDLTLDDVLLIPGYGSGTTGDQEPVDGMYMVWEANSGDQIVVGGLISTSHVSYVALSNLIDEQIPITQATVPPPWSW